MQYNDDVIHLSGEGSNSEHRLNGERMGNVNVHEDRDAFVIGSLKANAHIEDSLESKLYFGLHYKMI